MLTVCPTPIGNLGDISDRQRQALGGAQVIACEDTRVTGKLLELLGIRRADGVPQLVSYHDHNEQARVGWLVEQLQAGVSVTLVSDAGTPGVADPGYRLIAAAREAGVRVDVLPGACAAVLGLVGAGFATDRFEFWGFLSPKSSARREQLSQWLGGTLVLYESPQRVHGLLEDVLAVCPQARVHVARELTKMHEEHVRGEVAEVLSALSGRVLKGECVVVLWAAPKVASSRDAQALTSRLVVAGLKPAVVKEIVAQTFGVSKSEVFEWIQALKVSG